MFSSGSCRQIVLCICEFFQCVCFSLWVLQTLVSFREPCKHLFLSLAEKFCVLHYPHLV